MRAFYNLSKVYILLEEFEEAKELLRQAKQVCSKPEMIEEISANVKLIGGLLKARAGGKDEGGGSHRPMEVMGGLLCKFRGSVEEKKPMLKLALSYYERAFARAENEMTRDVLPALNNSIAETLKDLEFYDQALMAFEKQLVSS